MINLDKFKQKKTDCQTALCAAIKENDEAKMSQALDDYGTFLAEAISIEATTGTSAFVDAGILSARGVRQLTQKETAFYEKFITAAKSADPKQAIAGITEAMPVTIIESVIEDIRKSHELLDLIDFKNTTALLKIIVNKTGKPNAVWGDITAAITNEISGNLGVIDAALYKLSAFMFVAFDLLDLGPAWVDKYVRETLIEYSSASMEDAAVDGDGNKKPIGMTRSVADDVTVTAGVYPRKTAIVVTSLGATSFGDLLKRIAKDRNGQARKVENLVFICNPFDYFGKVMPATTIRAADGTYVNNVLPFPCRIIQSAALPEGYAVLGMAKRYLAGVGVSKDGKIEYDDSYKFLEDCRTYKIKLHATGVPLDDNAFLYLDIRDLKPEDLKVLVTNSTAAPVNTKEVVEIPAG